MANGYALSSKFKTADTFGHQPVIVVNEKLKELLQLYVLVARKKLIGKHLLIQNKIDVFNIILLLLVGRDSDTASLWVCRDGKDLDTRAVGHRLTEYFTRISGFHITTNTIRRLAETEADESYANRCDNYYRILLSVNLYIFNLLALLI